MSDAKIAASEELPTSSGTTSLEGYIYQQDVSVLLSLDILLVKRLADRVVLEPVTEEDLETDIADEPGALVQSMVVNGYRLIVQCKVKSTGPWSHGEISRLLKHGTRRVSAAERLKDEKTRYLLVTTADLDGVARKLRVEEAGAWPAASEMPPSIGNEVPNAAGRVAILGSMDQERVETRIDRVLRESFRVSESGRKSCKERLKQDALERMLGGNGGVWTRADIERRIKEFGGYVGESADLDGFVRPTNWKVLERALDEQHALIITGASGTGKTRAAKALIAGLRERIPGIRHAVIRGGPDKVFEDTLGGPVVYEIEDPWGKFRLDENSVPWNDAIDDLLQTANGDRKFVVTNRSDVLTQSAPRSLRAKWIAKLEEENYGPDERARLFENRVPTLPYELQSIVVRHRKDAVDGLATPLEMHRFFSVLADGPEKDEHERDYIRRCLHQAHQTSIESAIVSNVRARDDWRWAAIVWGLFKAGERQSFATMPKVQGGLSELDPVLEDGLTRYVAFLVAGRNLRQADEVLTYQHPRVELGLEQAMLEKPNQSSRVLRYLVQTLVGLDHASGGDWGTEAAANLLAATKKHTSLQLRLPQDVTDEVDAWLAARVSATGSDFEDDLKLAAAAGSAENDVAELARWLTYRDENRPWHAFVDWEAPKRPDEWYVRISVNPHTAEICRAFVKRILPRTHGHYGRNFTRAMARLSNELTSAFIEAADRIVEGSYTPNENAILEGALEDLDRFEPVVRHAVDYRAKLDANRDDVFWLALLNGEYDEEAAEHYYEQANDEGYMANEVLEAYVQRRRERDGWKAIAGHPLASGMVLGWLKALQLDPAATPEEWEAVAALAAGWEAGRLWEAARGRLVPTLLPALETALRKGGPRRDTRTEVARTAILDAPDLFQAVAVSLSEKKDYARLLELVLDATNPRDRDKTVDAGSLGAMLRACLPAPVVEVVAHLIENPETALSPVGVSLLQSVEDVGRLALQLARARLLSRAQVDVHRLLSAILEAHGDDSSESVAEAAEALDLAEESGAFELIDEALAHRLAEVRRHALLAKAARSSTPLGDDLLAMADDKSSFVRRSLVDVLSKRPHPSHTVVLVKLSGDQWSRHVYSYDDADHPIAVEAAEALLNVRIDDRHIEELMRVVETNKDPDVQMRLLRALVRNGSAAARARVWALAMAFGTPPLHRYAADALVTEYDKLEPDEASSVPDIQLLQRIAGVALPLALLVGCRATEKRVLEVAEKLAEEPQRVALLIPLMVGAFDQSNDLGARVRNLLPLSLQTLFATLPEAVPVVTAKQLSPYGDVRMVNAVLTWLQIFHQKTDPAPENKSKGRSRVSR